MTMRNLMIYVLAPFVLALWHPHAYAGFKLKFGTDEHIRFVSNTSLQGPNGEGLFLARKVAEKSFLLPYSIEDNGFVLGISGGSTQYFPLPQGQELEAFQRAGHLPNPLPIYELSPLDLIFGHLLWITLLALVAYGAYKYLTRHREVAPSTSQLQGRYVAQPEQVSQYANADLHLPLRLYPSRLKMLGLLAISVAFVTIGLLMSRDEPVMGYVVAGFFGLCMLVFLVQLIPGSSYLELTNDNFTYSGLFKKTKVDWEDVAVFGVTKISHNKMVGWLFSESYTGQRAGRALSNALTGVEGALPDTYGMKTVDLAELMNEIKRRHSLGHL